MFLPDDKDVVISSGTAAALSITTGSTMCSLSIMPGATLTVPTIVLDALIYVTKARLVTSSMTAGATQLKYVHSSARWCASVGRAV